MKHIDMEKFAGGAFTTQINRELEKVTENIQDSEYRCHCKETDYSCNRIQAK